MDRFYQHSSILGGERGMSIHWISGGISSIQAAATISPSVNDPGNAFDFDVSRGPSQLIYAEGVWDGIDGSSAINHTGLGGVNLSAVSDGISFSVWADAPATNWTFQFYSDATHFSTYIWSKGTTTSYVTSSFSPLFSEFTAAGSGGGADFSDIGAIRISDSTAAASATYIYDVQSNAIPEPSALGLVGPGVAGSLIRRRRQGSVRGIMEKPRRPASCRSPFVSREASGGLTADVVLHDPFPPCHASPSRSFPSSPFRAGRATSSVHQGS